MALRGCLAATRAPIIGNTRKRAPPTGPAKVRLTSQLSGTSAERASAKSATLATYMATERTASDHARREVRRGLIALLPVDGATTRRGWAAWCPSPTIPGHRREHRGPFPRAV